MSCCKKMWCGCCCILEKIGMVLQPFLLLLMRLYWGAGFILAGIGKLTNLDGTAEFFGSVGFPAPFFMVILAALTEILGGTALILGFISRFFSFALIIVMVTAYATAHAESLQMILQNPQMFVEEAPFNFLLTALIVFCFGPGKLSIDHFKEKRCHGGSCSS